MGLFGAIGGIIGAAKVKKASKKAAKAQIAGMQKGIEQQQSTLGTIGGYYSPYTTAGTSALSRVSDLLGLGTPEAQQAAIEGIQNSPYYQSLYRTGLETNLQNAAATGGIRGGNEVRSLADFGADTLSQAIQQQLQNLGAVTQLGYGATNNLSGFTYNTGANISNLLTGQGQAKATGIMNAAQAAAQMWKGIGGLGDQVASFAAGGFGAPGAGFNLGAAMGSPGGQALFGVG